MPGITSQSRPHCCLSSAVPGPAFMDLFAFCCRRVVLFDHYQGNDDDGYRLYDILIFLNKQQSEFVDSSPLSLTTSLPCWLAVDESAALCWAKPAPGMAFQFVIVGERSLQVKYYREFVFSQAVRPSIHPSNHLPDKKASQAAKFTLKCVTRRNIFRRSRRGIHSFRVGSTFYRHFFCSFPTHPQFIFIID